MKFLFDFFPVILFFIIYKWAGIYAATTAAIVVSVLQLAYMWFKHKRVEKMLLFTTLTIVILGGATLFFHNEWFIKWKPTVINWMFSLAFLGSEWIGHTNLVQRMLGKQIELPKAVWTRLNGIWGGFFLIMGALNIIVAYTFSTDTWVNFKLFGILGLTVLFVVFQAWYVSQHLPKDAS